MRTRKLRKTTLQVSEVGLGCWPLGGKQEISGEGISYGDISENDALKIISKSLEYGINTFDTADSYSFGGSEIRLGKALSEKRKAVNIFTKAGYVPSAYGLFEIDITHHHLISALRRSLKRLNTDYVDIFQVHQVPKNENDFKEIEKTFSELKGTGEAKFCGVSIARELSIGSELVCRGLVDSLQMYFSVLDYKPSEDLFKEAHDAGVGIITSIPLAQGFLSGKFHSGITFDKKDIRNRLGKDEIDKRIERTNQLIFLITKNRTLSQAALAYVLSFKEVSTCIPGVKNLNQLKENVDAASTQLSNEEMKQIKEIQNSWH